MLPTRFRHKSSDDQASAISTAILALVASGTAVTRADLARALKVSASTVTLKVSELVASGIVEDAGPGDPTGGRPARILRVVPRAGLLLAAALGRAHARVGLIDLSGTLLTVHEIPLSVTDGPERVLPELVRQWRLLLDDQPAARVHGVGVSLPGPVDVTRGVVISPADMLGWDGFPVNSWLVEQLGVRAVIDNDANMGALGEFVTRSSHGGVNRARTLVFIKAGTALGGGLIVNGHLHHGVTWLGGDIAHVRVPVAGDRLCSCGNRGCLTTVASARSLIQDLQQLGRPVHHTLDIVRLVDEGDAEATARVRAAGQALGGALAMLVNFINPDLIALGGGLALSEPFIAAVRSSLYEDCHPLATRGLRIEQALADRDAALRGAGELALRQVIHALETA